MLTAKFGAVAILILAAAAVVAGQSPKNYPGATKYTAPDTEETREALKALPPGTQVAYYLTNDSFEKVVAFYKGVAREYTMPDPGKNRKLPSRQELKSAYFIFDGAADLAASKSWAKVQRPFIGSVKMNRYPPEYHDIRDVTAIVLTEKK